MKKFVLTLVIVAILAVAAGATGVAYAQGQTPTTPQNPGSGFGGGMMNGRGGRSGMAGQGLTGDQSGFLHAEMTAAFAEKLGLTVDELNARLAEGETIATIAFSQGLTSDQFRTLMVEARTQALDQAVTDGKLTQEQADWMKTRGAGMMGGNGRGAGQGQFANPACPYYTQPNP